jgi:hypothetical protein
MDATAANLSLDLIARVTRASRSSRLRLSGDVGEASAHAAAPPDDERGDARRDARGAAEEEPYRDARTTPRVTGILHWDIGAHRVKAGLTVASHRFESRRRRRRRGASPSATRSTSPRSTGSYPRRSSRMPGAARSGLPESAYFVQDAWAVTDALTLTLGFRMDGYRLPAVASTATRRGPSAIRARRHRAPRRSGRASRRASGSAGRSGPIGAGSCRAGGRLQRRARPPRPRRGALARTRGGGARRDRRARKLAGRASSTTTSGRPLSSSAREFEAPRTQRLALWRSSGASAAGPPTSAPSTGTRTS